MVDEIVTTDGVKSSINRSDIVIAGGGLAGLGLAYQITKAAPELSITVLEKQSFPRPRAIAKVGESTVEIGSRYLSRHLDLRDHLAHNQLKKFGIRMFFGSVAGDLANCDELGASQSFGIPTYQIDRGDLENTLYQRVTKMGVRVVQNADISDVAIGDKNHITHYSIGGQRSAQQSRWLIDASGRRALIKSTLGLQKDNDHRSSAVWFRIDKRIEIDEWSQAESWRQRCHPEGRRWLSTNHLTGAGYWLWIIPLASGITSVGIVMDDPCFEQAKICDEPSTRAWIQQHHPRCADAIKDANFLDFVVLPNYSYGCKQIISDQGWAIVGEAGFFTDPFYSPGTDFIAIANCFITQLVVDDAANKDTRFTTRFYEKLFHSIYENTLSLYTEQYGGFGDRRMMSLKLLWDYTYYWGVLSLLFFSGALQNVLIISEISRLLAEAQTINQRIQSCLKKRANKRRVLPPQGLFIDQYQVPCLHEFNQTLATANAENCKKNFESNMQKLRAVANAVEDMLSDSPKAVISDEERDVIGGYREWVLA